jgi:hypothetical protein
MAKWLIRDTVEVARTVKEALEDDVSVDEEDKGLQEDARKTGEDAIKVRPLKRCGTEGCNRYVANVYAKVNMPEDLIEGEYCHNDDYVDDSYCVFCMRVYDDGRYSEAVETEPTDREGVG